MLIVKNIEIILGITYGYLQTLTSFKQLIIFLPVKGSAWMIMFTTKDFLVNSPSFNVSPRSSRNQLRSSAVLVKISGRLETVLCVSWLFVKVEMCCVWWTLKATEGLPSVEQTEFCGRNAVTFLSVVSLYGVKAAGNAGPFILVI